MEVSTKLFNAQATKNFSKINEQIQDTQAKIASGKSFLKASDVYKRQLYQLVFEKAHELFEGFWMTLDMLVETL